MLLLHTEAIEILKLFSVVEMQVAGLPLRNVGAYYRGESTGDLVMLM
jgi:hypothetical protein